MSNNEFIIVLVNGRILVPRRPKYFEWVIEWVNEPGEVDRWFLEELQHYISDEEYKEIYDKVMSKAHKVLCIFIWTTISVGVVIGLIIGFTRH